jgi:hypothetical protein
MFECQWRILLDIVFTFLVFWQPGIQVSLEIRLEFHIAAIGITRSNNLTLFDKQYSIKPF